MSSNSKDLELKLAEELHLFFAYLEKKILKNVDYEHPLEAFFYQQVNTVIQENWKEYDKIIMHYADKAGMLSYAYYDLMKAAAIKHSLEYATKSDIYSGLKPHLGWYQEERLVHYNPQVYNFLEQYEFKASEKTMNRVTREINAILSEGYYTEKGHYYIRDRIQEKFTKLKTYEAMRIAQTEVNAARNFTQYAALYDDNMEYIIWNSANDSRVRDSHKDHPKGVGNTIVPIGKRFENGLLYPADRDGTPIKEWVKCRCSHSAYIIPLGYAAPNFFPFTEADLVKVDSDPRDFYSLETYPSAVLPQDGYDLNGDQILEPRDIIKIIGKDRNDAFNEIAAYHNAIFLNTSTADELGNEYYTFVQEYDDGKHMWIYFSKDAADKFEARGWTHPVQILDELFKVPNILKRDTREIWFKDTTDGIDWNPTTQQYDKLGDTIGGYNTHNTVNNKHHRIVISPKYFIEINDEDTPTFHNNNYGNARNWIMTIHHEFAHTIDTSDDIVNDANLTDFWESDSIRLSSDPLYLSAEHQEPHFTWYADTKTSESFAEHIGYVSSMLANPKNQKEKICCKFKKRKNGREVSDCITFEEYKKYYPKHYEYCTKLLTGSIPANYRYRK